MPEFKIDKMYPAGLRDVWTARVNVTFDGDLDGVDVGHVVQVTVRVSYPDNGDINGLYDAIGKQVAASTKDAAEFFADNTFRDLRQNIRETEEADFVAMQEIGG